MKNVTLVQMGPLVPNFDLEKVRHMANKAQKVFTFTVGDQITTVGSTDRDEQYKFNDLSQTLKQRSEEDINVLIGVIDSKIHNELYSGVDGDNQLIIVSLADIRNMLQLSRKGYNDYVLCEIGAQLLAIEYRRIRSISFDPEECGVPWHEETLSCLFDYDENRDHTYKKLMSPKLCAKCKALLAEANVGMSVQTACVNIVKAGLRAVGSALQETFHYV